MRTKSQIAKPWRCLCASLLISVIFLSSSSCNPPLRQMYLQPDALRVDSPSLSPDGRLIAFSFSQQLYRNGKNQLALFHVDSNLLEFPSQPERFSWADPSFTPDGKQLVLASHCAVACNENERGYHIGLLDLSTGKLRIVTKFAALGRRHPVVTPDGNEVWFIEDEGIELPHPLNRIPAFYGISAVTLAGGEERSVLPTFIAPIKFNSIFRLSFSDRREILFTAIGPHSSSDEMGIRPDGVLDANGRVYRLTSRGEIRDVEDPKLWGQVDVSWQNQSIVFIGGHFDYDIFLKTGEESRRITNLRSHIHAPAISADGGTIAFLADAERHMNWELWIADLKTDHVYKTDVRAKLKKLVGVE